MSHQVFIDCCRDDDPETARSLAFSIAKRFGIDPEQILGRLRRGRFRVRANLEMPSAITFMTYLEERGALCSIVDRAGRIVMQSEALASTVRTSMENCASDDGAIALKTLCPSDMGASTGPYDVIRLDEIGGASENLLPSHKDQSPSGNWELTTLDGKTVPSVIRLESSSSSHCGPKDEFMPPRVARESLVLDVVDRPVLRRREPAPVAERVRRDREVRGGVTKGQGAALAEPSSKYRCVPLPFRWLVYLADHARHRFAVGVFVAVLVGYGVMSPIAAGIKSKRYAGPIAELENDYAIAVTPRAWDALDEQELATVKQLKSRRTNIVVSSVVVWLLVASLFLFLWLKRIPWERWRTGTKSLAV